MLKLVYIYIFIYIFIYIHIFTVYEKKGFILQSSLFFLMCHSINLSRVTTEKLDSLLIHLLSYLVENCP